MIVPVASVSTDGYQSLRTCCAEVDSLHVSTFDDRPGKLFDGLNTSDSPLSWRRQVELAGDRYDQVQQMEFERTDPVREAAHYEHMTSVYRTEAQSPR